MLRGEVKRCWKEFIVGFDLATCPRPKGWNKLQCLEYLTDNPIIFEHDVAFLVRAVNERKELIRQASEEERNENYKLSKNWTGSQGHLRLLCTLQDDDVREAFLHRHDIGDRIEYDNRNSDDARKKEVWELMKDLWTDESWEPTTKEFGEVHSDFKEGRVLRYELVADLRSPTPEFIKTKYGEMNAALNKVIGNWGRSGQGKFGTYQGDVDDGDNDPIRTAYGVLGADGDSCRIDGALDNISNFTNLPYLLYMWLMLDKYNLVQSSMAQMDSTIACANGKDGIPSISGTASARFNEDDKETTGNNTEFRDISASITNLGASEEAAAKINAESNKATAKINAEASEATAKINAKASEATAKNNAKASKQASNAGEKAATQRAIDKLRK